MRNRMRRKAERISLAVMASLGTVVLVAGPLGLDRFLPVDVVPKITLLVLSTVTLFLLLEVERFQSLDNIDARLSELDIDTIAQNLKRDHYAGVVAVHHRFPVDTFIRHAQSAKEVTILNTWIPNLQTFEQLLIDALNRKARVRILLLYPNSGVAQLRDEALRTLRDPTLAENVKDGVRRCLAILESILRRASKHRKAGLEVKLYNSLPSISTYRADAHYLVSMFFHDQLAIESPQFEIDGTDTILGKQVQRELDTLWEIGKDIDVRNWQVELDRIVF